MTSASERVSEQLRRAAARSTKEIVLRRGRDLGMYVGAGFPKSGTVWLCQLMGTYLGVPYPREYLSPVAMASVIHAHWRYDERFPPATYVRRDGRDVLVSFYFFYVAGLDDPKRPDRARRLRDTFTEMYGAGFDPHDVRANLPRFVEWQMTAPRASYGLPWHEHVADWWDRPRVGHVSYEGLLEDPVPELMQAMETMTGSADETLADLATRRWEFALASGRKAGTEDRGNFLRKGVAGDWRTHFCREAGEVFDSFAGAALVELGYAEDRSWWREL
jgi:hypothetical protein